MPLELVQAQFDVVKPAARKMARARADRHRIRLGDALQPRREVGGLADDRPSFRHDFADQVADDDFPRGDAHAHRQAGGLVSAAGTAYAADGIDDREAGVHGALGIVLVRLRVAEIGHDAVAAEFRHPAVVAADLRRDERLVVSNDVAQVFRIEPGRQRRVADQVAEHDGELAALGDCIAPRFGDAGCRRIRSERGAARPAKPGFRRVRATAGGANDFEPGTAPLAEADAVAVIELAIPAVHVRSGLPGDSFARTSCDSASSASQGTATPDPSPASIAAADRRRP